MSKEILNVINSRRSVRNYKQGDIPAQDIKDILEAAMNAPSAGDERAWQFIVITDEKIKDAYAKDNPNAAYVKKAPVAILVAGDTKLEKYSGFYIQDCSAAVQNILLAAHAKGLGAVWCTVFPNNSSTVKELLNLPDSIIPFAMIPIGQVENMPAYKSRFDESRIHYNKF